MSKPDDVTYKGDAKPEQVVRAQQFRCCEAQSSGNPEIFAGSVLALLAVVPPEVRYAVEDAETEAVERIREIVTDLRRVFTSKNPPTDETLTDIIRKIMKVKSSTYTEDVEKWEYKYVNGIRLGTQEQPYYKNKRGDSDYDPNLNNGEPILVSPIRRLEPEINYYQLFTRINEECTLHGIGWEQEHVKERG